MDRKLTDLSLEELWELFPIILNEHNPQYFQWYDIEKQNILNALDNNLISSINHIGSSAVPGLISKPTVDILLEVVDDCDLSGLIYKLSSFGWMLMSTEDKPARLKFCKGYTINGFSDKVYHLHLRYNGDWDELYFRDYLLEWNFWMNRLFIQKFHSKM